VTRRDRGSDRPPDIEIGASARARKLRFRQKPKTRVEFEGSTRVRTDERIEDIDLETDERSERHNLPDEVEPGVTYRDVKVGWAAQARVRMPARIEGEDEPREKRRKRPRSS
jgi:hypothetical protein